MNKHHRKSRLSFLITLIIIICGIIILPKLSQIEIPVTIPSISINLPKLPEIPTNTSEPVSTKLPQSLQGNTLITTDACNTSGKRLPNKKVNIGYNSSTVSREYFGYTNEYSQLVYVEAQEIILQDDKTEDVTANNRYCQDEAKVDGVESSTLDEGHVIADSLGGVSNAYNITPQNSTLNRYGTQADIEELIRDSDGATNFVAVITYPNHRTQTPDSYTLSFTANNREYSYTFNNDDTENID